MLLTITTTRAPATDLGYLLHKHPDRLQTFAVSAGEAHVFYPEATPERCTAALLLEVDPIALVRDRQNRKHQPNDAELAQYVNDRPYAASSLLAVALKEAFRTALTGRCDARPELAAAPAHFETLPPGAFRHRDHRFEWTRAEFRDWATQAAGTYQYQVRFLPVGPRRRLVRPHPGAGRGVAEQHPVPGHGLCLRWPSDRLELSRTDYGFRSVRMRLPSPRHGLAGVRVAPFQLLATEGAVYHQRPHLWHLALADRLAAASPELIMRTRRICADTGDPASVTAWWEELTAAGGEGMVVKPAANLTRGPRGLVQPGLKVRGREYLRLIYGPDYTEPASLTRLRQRALSHKRSLALREYALGLEGPWTGWPAASRCGGYTNASSPSWPWNPNPSTRGSRPRTCGPGAAP